MRHVLRAAALLAVGLVLLEGALQLGAWAVRSSQRGAEAAFLTGDRRVLCLGDSNTYGIRVEPGEAWPVRLEALWNAAPGADPIEVVNLGFPGTNSSRVARDFDRLLAAFAPDVAILMVGANDYWTLPVPAAGSELGWLRRLRTVRLYYTMRRAVDQPELEATSDLSRTDAGSGRLRYAGEEFELGWREDPRPKSRADVAALDAALRRNLRDVADRAAAAGIPLVLMTYPAPERSYTAASRALREVARDGDTTLVDLAAAFDRACPEASCPDLLFDDGHPTARGYALVAETLVPALGTVLD